MTPSKVNILVALPAEAKPVRALFGLERLGRHEGFPVYGAGRISLVVSGVGKAAAAAATEFLNGLRANGDDAIWINLGIAGHANMAIGEAFLARSITDAASGRRWRARLPMAPALPTAPLVTVGRPSFDYAQPAAFDMEAAGFFPTARRFTRPELVHCLKIVSDNQHSPAEAINAKRVSAWIARQQDSLVRLLRSLDEQDPLS